MQEEKNEKEAEKNVHYECAKVNDSSSLELSVLISTIIDYYEYKNNSDDEVEEGEEWKKDKTKKIIPDVVSKGIQKAFIGQLKKYYK